MPEDPNERQFHDELTNALQWVREGTLSFDQLELLGSSREPWTLHFCMKKLANPELDPEEERVVVRLLRGTAPVRELFQSLCSIDPDLGECLASAFARATRTPISPGTGTLTFEEDFKLTRALGNFEKAEPGDGRLPALLALLSLESPGLQAGVAYQVALLDQDLAFAKRLLRKPAARIRAGVLEVLARRSDERALGFFRESSKDDDSRVRATAALGLCGLNEPEGSQVLTEMVRNGNSWEQRSALWALSLCGGEEHLSVLEELDDDEVDERTRSLALVARSAILERLSVPDR